MLGPRRRRRAPATVASCRYLLSGDLDARVTWDSSPPGHPSGKNCTAREADQPVVASSPRASPRPGLVCEQEKKRKEARTRAVAADVAATSNGLPTSPRARNSVTVHAVDIADAYSMSDGSSPEGWRTGGGGGGGRWRAGIAIEEQVGVLDEKMQRGSMDGECCLICMTLASRSNIISV